MLCMRMPKLTCTACVNLPLCVSGEKTGSGKGLPHVCEITSDLSSDKKKQTYKTLRGLVLSDSNNPVGNQIMIYVLWLESAWGSNAYVHGSWASHCSIGATQREYIWCKIASSVYNSIWSL